MAGPLDVFAEAGCQVQNRAVYTLQLVALELGPLRASNGVRLLPDATLEGAGADVDTLLVAGSPSMADYERNPVVADWVRGVSKSARRIDSVCSGVLCWLMPVRASLVHPSRPRSRASRRRIPLPPRLSHANPIVCVRSDKGVVFVVKSTSLLILQVSTSG